MYSPIVVFAYNRPEHLKRTLELLQCNQELSESPLYFFVDGPKGKSEDMTRVESVRSVVNDFVSNNHENAKVILRPQNVGLALNVIDGVSSVLKQYDRIIVLEDDISVAPTFLGIMNSLLDRYKNFKDIGALSGYIYPIKTNDIEDDFFLLPRASSWGWATWADRWENVDWDVADLNRLLADKTEQRKFGRGGEDLTPMLIKWKMGINDSWAVRWSYHLHLMNWKCLFPKTSLVTNHGNDGSGTHSPKSSKYTQGFSELEIVSFPDIPKEYPVLLDRLQRFFSLSLFRKMINRLTLNWSPNN